MLITREKIKEYLPVWQEIVQLMRLRAPIGYMLLLWPCWWGVALLGHPWPNLLYMLLFAIGAVAMRGAGCIVNDLVDRKFDAQVTRTKGRPLAAGRVSKKQALVLLNLLLLIGLLILCFLRWEAVYFALFAAVLMVFYPYAKRITYWPQLVLGLAFNMGVIIAWCGVVPFKIMVFYFYLAGIMWTLGYDTIYALQDIEDDKKIGVKSTAILFGDRVKGAIEHFYKVMFIILVIAGLVADLNKLYFLVLLLAGWQLYSQVYKLNIHDAKDCAEKFKSNNLTGSLIFLAIVLGRF